MILSDQQFEEIRQECPCFYYNTGEDEGCTATGEAKCFAARCPFLYWDKVVAKHELKIQNKDWLSILERLNKLENYNQLQLKEKQWAFTDDRGEQPAHYTKEYLLEILDCYKKLSGVDKSFESARRCHEHDHNRLMQTLDQKNEEIKQLHEERKKWKGWCEKVEAEVKAKVHETIVDLRNQLVRRDKEIQSLQKRLTEINDMIRPIFSISNIPRGSVNCSGGGIAAGTKTLATNDIEQGKEETIKYHPV